MSGIFLKKLLVLLSLAALLAGCALPSGETPAATEASIVPTQAGPAVLNPTAELTSAVETASPATPQSGAPHPAGPLWLANPTEGTLRILDPADNSTAVVIPTGMKPDRVVMGEGSAWALDPTNDVLIQVDPQNYTIRAVVRFPGQDVSALAVGAGAVWVGVTERSSVYVLQPKEDYRPVGGVLRIDPVTGKTTGYAKVGPVLDLAFSGSSLWALIQGQVDTPLERIDPTTLTASAVSLTGTPDWLDADAFSAGSDGLWIYSSGFGRLYHTNFTGQLYATLTLGQRKPLSAGQAALREAFGSVWLAAPWGHVLRIDPATMRISADIPLNAPTNALVENSGALWALSPSTGSAYRIDPQSGAVVSSAGMGSPALPTPILTPTAVHRAYAPCEDSPLSRLKVGMFAVTPTQPALANRLHKEDFKDSDVTGYIQPGQRVAIVEGPFCNDTWVWWRVKVPASGASGWAAEGDASTYWLIPVP